ncbi:unnamed protein product [Acanthoscelides obtectus]|uniref:Carboxylic ester hydrolase n=1 Tax=Acanthoscelides obtectus TaxID=200917 RepID=A0A9P0JSH4_ACAOB|nr:unnamed protein product [Acanthoscelides obtectus]CAK1661886.1 hypothetical protein AOBTE_LOCUS22859 [Acanthoscelides obtectus]
MFICYIRTRLLGAKRMFVLPVILLLLQYDWVYAEHPQLTTPSGSIKGSLLTSRLGKTIYAFRGIRYAEPPVGELRFKPPVAVETWNGTYDATKDGSICPQPTAGDPVSEDCLMLNVYSTKLPKGKDNPKRPVIVYILPGAFYSTTSVSYWAGPQYFMDQDIVFVTFNYRLGSLGFLATGDKESPGNYGMKDQVVVLKWVQKNIASFGGDPDSVTLLGYSAGSWSIIFHMVSPMSKGLFHKGIAMSGSPVGGWPIPTGQLDIAKKQARLVGCPDDTSKNIVNCLKTKSAKELGDSFFGFREFGYDPILIWSPVIEPEHIPFITGQTKDEFSYSAFNVVNNETLTKEMNEDWDRIAPISFIYERGTKQSLKVSRAIRKFYLDDKPISKSNREALGKIYSDSIETFPINRAVKLMAQYNKKPVYYYRFSFQGRYSHFYLPGTNNTVPYGVVHHDDLIYLFYIQRLFPRFNATSPRPEIDMVQTLTTLHTNFAKTGNPTPTRNPTLDNVKWDTFNLDTQKYLDIGEKLVMKERMYEDRVKLWEDLYPLSMYN